MKVLHEYDEKIVFVDLPSLQSIKMCWCVLEGINYEESCSLTMRSTNDINGNGLCVDLPKLTSIINPNGLSFFCPRLVTLESSLKLAIMSGNRHS